MHFDERNGNTVLGRAFRLLTTLEASSEDLSLAELARRSGLPKPTAYRLAGQLVDLGVLNQSQSGYGLGSRLFEFGHAVAAYRRFREIAMPFMGDLYEATRQTVNLGAREGTSVLYLEKLSSHKPSPVATTAGTRKPLYCTALGKAMLAFSRVQLLKEVTAEGLRPFTRHSIAAPSVLMKELERIRSDGVAFDQEEYEMGTVCVAAPLRAADGIAFGAISLTGRAEGWDVERYGAATRATALGLNRALLEPRHAQVFDRLWSPPKTPSSNRPL